MTAEQEYAAMVAAAAAQSARLRAPMASTDRWDRAAARFRLDPHRELDSNLQAVRSLVQPTDVLIDVGGGAGRVSLPLALTCREVINVEPSPAMAGQFLASAAEAHIENARVVPATWPDAPDVSGDVALVCNVTYFVGAIVPFLERLVAATRRRVIISVWSVPPPIRDAAIFEVATGEPELPCPGHRQLCDVLWEMGILPDVQVLPGPFPLRAAPAATPAAAIEAWLDEARLSDRDAARERLVAGFDRVFVNSGEGYRPAQRRDSREMLITWPTA